MITSYALRWPLVLEAVKKTAGREQYKRRVEHSAQRAYSTMTGVFKHMEQVTADYISKTYMESIKVIFCSLSKLNLQLSLCMYVWSYPWSILAKYEASNRQQFGNVELHWNVLTAHKNENIFQLILIIDCPHFCFK